MAATGLLINFYRDRGTVSTPHRPTRHITRHDLAIKARAKFHDDAGEAIDLTGKTVRYSLRDVETDALIVDRAAAVLELQSTNLGEAYYAYTAGQVAHALTGIEEWHLIHADTTTETFPVGTYRQPVMIGADIDAA